MRFSNAEVIRTRAMCMGVLADGGPVGWDDDTPQKWERCDKFPLIRTADTTEQSVRLGGENTLSLMVSIFIWFVFLSQTHIFWETPQDQRFFSTTAPTLLVPVTVSSSNYTLQLLLLLLFC